MLRLGVFILSSAVILAAMFRVSVWIFFIPIVILAVLAYTVGGMKHRCPACGKRIKLGYTACAHCGRSVARGG